MIKADFGRFGKEFSIWVRVFGYGFGISNLPPLFSERYGYRKAVRIFGVKFEYLPKR